MKWKLKSELIPRNPEIKHFSETLGIHRSDEETLDLIAKRIIEKLESNQKHFFDVFTINVRTTPFVTGFQHLIQLLLNIGVHCRCFLETLAIHAIVTSRIL